MAEPQKVSTPKPNPAAAAILAKLPPQLNQRIVAALTLEERLALYNLTLDAFLSERKKTDETEDTENYRYGNFFADLHGPEATFHKLVQDYAGRIMSEGWQPLWWYAPVKRDVNAGGMDLVKVMTVRLRARRLRADVTLRRE